MIKITENIIKSWITSLIGLFIMSVTAWESYTEFDSLELQHVLIIIIMMGLGLALFKSRDKIIFDIFKSKTK